MCLCVCVLTLRVLCFGCLQAYRLEPLINSAYERVKPVKIDRCAAGPSENAQELASGPRPDLVEPVKKGWMSYLPSIAKGSVAVTESVATAASGSANNEKKVFHNSYIIVVCS